MFKNKDIAFLNLKMQLRKEGYLITKEYPKNKGRDLLIVASKKGKTEIFWAKFKRDFFHSFNKEFPYFVSENPQFSGYGESININHLEEIIKFNCDLILFCYANGKVYSVFPLFFKKFGETHKLIRIQERTNLYLQPDYSGEKKPVQEMTLSIPLSLLKRFI